MLGTAYDEATPLLGRIEERDLLASLFDEVDMHGQALVLRGEPGSASPACCLRPRGRHTNAAWLF